MKITCMIATLVIEFDVHSKKMYQELLKYQSSLKPQFFVESELVESVEIPNGKPDIHSSFYKLYKEPALQQVQFDENKHAIGKIEYFDNRIKISYNKEHVFQKEYLLMEYALVYFVLKNKNAIFIHSSAFSYHDKGILLIANSGTGKSTHARLWSRYENITQINDDKNLILYENDQLMIYGNPFAGKHLVHQNIVVPLTHLVFLHQSKENEAKILSKREQLLSLLPHMMNTSFFYTKEKWDFMTNKLLEIRSIALGCDISQEAVETLKKEL